MNPRFIHKHFMTKPQIVAIVNPQSEEKKKPVQNPRKNNKAKKDADMNTNEQIEAAEVLANSMAPEVKVVKKDRGLIERTESSKIILTEDNRQVLND